MFAIGDAPLQDLGKGGPVQTLFCTPGVTLGSAKTTDYLIEGEACYERLKNLPLYLVSVVS